MVGFTKAQREFMAVMSLDREARAASADPAANLIFYQVEKNQVSAETLEIIQVSKSRNQAEDQSRRRT